MIETGSTGTGYQNPCSSRLPCGLCLITNSPCPFVMQTITPIWKVTCGSDSISMKDYPNTVTTTAYNGEEQT